MHSVVLQNEVLEQILLTMAKDKDDRVAELQVRPKTTTCAVPLSTWQTPTSLRPLFEQD